jgi:hypothetical protein
MIPGIGHQCNKSFCHRILGNNTCGSNSHQCAQCIASEAAKQVEEERKLQHALFLRMQEEERQQHEQRRAREELERNRIQAEEARQRDIVAKEAEALRRLEAEKKEQQRLEEAMQEAARQKLVTAQLLAKQAAEKLLAQALKDKAETEAAAALVEAQLREWAQVFRVGRWVQVQLIGPHFNKFALVVAKPRDDGCLTIRLFKENVSVYLNDEALCYCKS